MCLHFRIHWSEVTPTLLSSRITNCISEMILPPRLIVVNLCHGISLTLTADKEPLSTDHSSKRRRIVILSGFQGHEIVGWYLWWLLPDGLQMTNYFTPSKCAVTSMSSHVPPPLSVSQAPSFPHQRGALWEHGLKCNGLVIVTYWELPQYYLCAAQPERRTVTNTHSSRNRPLQRSLKHRG